MRTLGSYLPRIGGWPVLALAILAPAVAAAPADAFKALPLSEIQAGGWMRQQILRDITAGNSAVLDQLRPLGAPMGEAPGKPGYGEFEGNFMDAVVRSAFLTGHQPWLVKAKAAVDHVLTHQDAAGYVGRGKPADFSALAQTEIELWGQCVFLRALLAYHEYDGNPRYLEAARRSVDHMMSVFGDPKNRYFIGDTSMEGGARAHGLMYVEVLEKLYELTGDRKYVDFGFRLYDDYSHGTAMQNVDHQLDRLLDASLPFLFHAPHVAEHSRVIFWLAQMTDDRRFHLAAQNTVRKLRNALSPSGGLITDDAMLEAVAGHYGSAELRYEYCSLVESQISLASAFRKLGDPTIAEDVENIVFNAAQAARFADGRANAYTSKDNQLEAAGIHEKPSFRHQYAACHRIACCVYNVGRVMPHYMANLWLKHSDGSGVVAGYYGPSTVTTEIAGVKVTIDEQTLYPFENTVDFIINPATTATFAVTLRNPSWSRHTQVDAPGAKITRTDGYITVTKAWSRGDRIAVSFDPATEVRSSFNNEVYVRRGALLYALPIKDRRVATLAWPIEGFANYDITADPADVARYRSYRLPNNSVVKSRADASLFVYEKKPSASADFPYDTPYGAIRTKFKVGGNLVTDELVPIGSTVLRRTTFAETR